MTCGAQVTPVVAHEPTFGKASEEEIVQLLPPLVEVAICMFLPPLLVE
jgi:hypothetical protein